MFTKRTARLSAASTVLSIGMVAAASAASVQISITNNQAADGVYLTPLASILHNGSFDSFDRGVAASASVELLAEEGDPSLVLGDAAAAGAVTGAILAPGGFGGAPVLDPGETASIQLDVADPTSNRFFSFLSMVIPSNDVFIGNDNSMAYEVFNAIGEFTGIGPILVYSDEAWDAGTEVNNGSGAPFNTAGGSPIETDGVVVGAADNLFFLNGQNTPAGTTIDLSGRTLLATIEISQVPVPASLPLLLVGLGGIGLMRRRRARG
ncbi:MAG: spondin domain-containing protein [Paracoccaceae bacterium]